MIKFLKREKIIKISKICLLICLAFTISGVGIKQSNLTNKSDVITAYNPTTLNENKNVEVETLAESKTKLDEYIQINEETIRFFANMFDMDYDIVINKIKEINPNGDSIIENNIGYLVNENNEPYDFGSIDRGILELFLYLENAYPDLVIYNYVPYNGSAEYVEALVEYFSSLYPNVDSKLMLSIGAAESGYYTSETMLSKNNIYGGMGSNGLIAYKNIEYGVMQYIKKMSEKYYNYGLDTPEKIGYVFCPTTQNGVKTVSSHWLNLVNKALEKYTYDIRYVSVAQLNDLLYGEFDTV